MLLIFDSICLILVSYLLYSILYKLFLFPCNNKFSCSFKLFSISICFKVSSSICLIFSSICSLVKLLISKFKISLISSISILFISFFSFISFISFISLHSFLLIGWSFLFLNKALYIY